MNSFSKPRLLVIDPDKEFCHNVRLFLEADYQVEVRHSVRYLRETILLHRIQLIIVDVGYADKDFIPLIEELRDQYPQLKIILMYTYFTTDKNRERILASDVDGILAKPFDVDQLKNMIDRLLANRQNVT